MFQPFKFFEVTQKCVSRARYINRRQKLSDASYQLYGCEIIKCFLLPKTVATGKFFSTKNLLIGCKTDFSVKLCLPPKGRETYCCPCASVRHKSCPLFNSKTVRYFNET